MKPTFIACMLSFLFFHISSSISGQDLHVYFNLYNDSVTYVKDGKTLHQPRLRKGEDIQVHLTEFNPFLYEVEIEVEETHAVSGMGAAAMSGFMPGLPGLPGVSGIAGSMMGGESHDGSFIPFMDIPLLTINDSPLTLRSLFAGSRGSAEVMDHANRTMTDIVSLTEEIQLAFAELKAKEKALRVTRMALVNVDRIKMNPHIKPSLIRAMCKEYYQIIFQTEGSGNEISLHDLLSSQDLPMEYQLVSQKLKSKGGELTAKTGLLQGLSDQLQNMGIEDPDFEKYNRDLKKFLANTKDLQVQLREVNEKTEGLVILPAAQEIADLQLRLAEVTTNDFAFHTRLQPKGDDMTVFVKVHRKSDPESGADRMLVKERSLRFEAKGGLKISASVGVNFGQYFSPAEQYSVSNDVIVGENEGSFIPTITSFLHFYSYRGQRASLGGSFGLGIPVLGDGDSQSLQFFLGPSIILGGSQRLVLTAGIMGGRVRRLARGYQVGDPFDPFFGDIPTRGKYDLGMFFGASFNLGN